MQFAQKDVSMGRGDLPCRREQLRWADIEEYRTAVEGSWDACFVQLSPGHLNAGIDCLSGENFVLYRESWSQRLYTQGALLPGMIAFGIPERPAIDARWWGRLLPSNWLPYGRSCDELSLVTEPGEAITVLVVVEKDFRDVFHGLTGLDSDQIIKERHFIAVRSEYIPRLHAFWSSTLAHTAGPGPHDLELADLIAPLAEAMNLPQQSFERTAKDTGVLERVLHLAEKSTYLASIPEISRRLCISRRAIEYSFRNCLGTSPIAYFTAHRLELCRQALLDADPAERTVTEIATRFGFNELGRFAGLFHRQFGRLPSETLRQAPRKTRARSSLKSRSKTKR